MNYRTLNTALVLSLCAIAAYPTHAVSSDNPLQSVDYASSGRAECDLAVSLYNARTCLLSLQAVITGGTPPIHVKWILSNGTRLSGQNISLAISRGEILYDVCLRAVDSRGQAVFGGHWEFGINYGSDKHHAHKYAPVNVWYASVSPPCATVGQPVDFRGNVFCSSECSPPPIVSTWSFGDGNMIRSENVIHNYMRPRIFSAKLQAIDSLGTMSSTTYPVIVIEIGQQHRPQSGKPN